ncbi:MAG: beta-ketoacyl synthase N-terminal-like domain-containing protein, partial [Phycisphaerae bacterium]
MNAREVCITGIGPVASVGTGCDAFWTALVEGHSHIEDRSLVIDLDQSVDLPIAGMKPPEDLPDMAHHLSSLEPHHLEAQRDAAYSLRAIELAFEDAG